ITFDVRVQYGVEALHSVPTRRSSDLQVDIEQAPPIGLIKGFQRLADLNTRVIEQNIHRADFSFDAGDLCLNALGIDHIKGCAVRSEEHTSELQSRENLVCRLLLEKRR